MKKIKFCAILIGINLKQSAKILINRHKMLDLFMRIKSILIGINYRALLIT